MTHHSICRLHAVTIILLVTCLAALLAGCRHGASPDAGPDAKRYELKGTVVSVDERGETVTVAHGEIPGYMDAMTMPFKPKDHWVLEQAKPGNRIQATLVVDGLRSWLEDVVLVEDSPAGEQQRVHARRIPNLPHRLVTHVADDQLASPVEEAG